MFRAKNFCHIASNNRNNVKVGVFVYRTTDNLATVLVSGYFNERIIDINLHDIIIHEKIDATDNTKVEKNVLCVTERTLDNVGTTVIKSKWEGDIEQEIEDLRTYVNNNFVKIDGTSIMTGPLLMRATDDFKCAIAPYWDGIGFFKLNNNDSVTLMASIEYNSGFEPATTDTYNIGVNARKWKNLYLSGAAYLSKINNGYDIAVPVTNSADTLALKSQVDDAANSGEQLYSTGVWYAKMYAGTTPPASAEVEGRNYADFSQVDGQGDPIIVVYTYTSGSWATTATITPPKNHNGYMTITSKIWDISEQAGQQGGKVLWSHSQGTFTPYPQIISFENAALTGTPTAPTPDVSSPNNQIATKEYVDNASGSGGVGRNVGDIFFTSRNDSALNGAVECDGDTYNTSDFSGVNSIGALLEAGKVPYVSLSQYATLLSANGSVGVFGWDGIGTTPFRVPSLNDVFIETGTSAELGDYEEAGLPNITAEFTSTNTWGGGLNLSGAAELVGSYGNGGYGGGNGRSNSDGKIAIKGSNSSAIYGNSTTVQPNAVRYRAMVQLATEATDEALETCTQVLSDVADLQANKVAKGHEVIEFQQPTALNNYTWYRKYADGWVEMGGRTTQASTSQQALVLPLTMADANYQVLANAVDDNLSGFAFCVQVKDKTTTGFKTQVYASYQGGTATNGYSFDWEVKGMIA